MKNMKLILVGMLIFGTLPSVNTYSFSDARANGFHGSMPSTSERQVASTNLPIEVELIRMVDPFGNEVKYSLSESVMGRQLKNEDYEISGVNQKPHSPLCQKTLTQSLELQKIELKLELEMLVEEMASQPKPRKLTELQIETLERVPQCENFRLPLTAIVKLLDGYDYDSFAMISIPKN